MGLVDPRSYRFSVGGVFKSQIPRLSKGYSSYGICCLELFVFLVSVVYFVGFLHPSVAFSGIFYTILSIFYLCNCWLHFVGHHFNSRSLLLLHCYSSIVSATLQFGVILCVMSFDVKQRTIFQIPVIREHTLNMGIGLIIMGVFSFIFAFDSYGRAKDIKHFKKQRKRFIFSMRALDAFLHSSFTYPMPKYMPAKEDGKHKGKESSDS